MTIRSVDRCSSSGQCVRIRNRRSWSSGCPTLAPESGVVFPVREKAVRGSVLDPGWAWLVTWAWLRGSGRAVTFPERSGRTVAFVRHSRGHRVGVAAWSLAGVTMLVLAAALVLLGLDTSKMAADRIATYGIAALAVVVYAGTGRLVASRVPGNAIGWLLGLVGLSLAVTLLTEQYALRGLAVAPWSLPAARVVGWLSAVAFIFTFAPMFFLVLLFPDGRLPSRRWRPVLWAMFAVTTGWVTQQLQVGTRIDGGLTNALYAARVSYPTPFGIFPRHGWFSDLLGVELAPAVITGVLVVVSVFVRRRGASAELRKQLAWLGYVGALVAVALFWTFLLVISTVGIPLACTVAVLKYRLYEIDRIISRTLAYAIVTGLLIGVYTGLVLLATQVFRFHAPLAVAASTLAAAALFTPLRSRVQRRVDRRFNRARYDADQTIGAFAARLKDVVDLDSVQCHLPGPGTHSRHGVDRQA